MSNTYTDCQSCGARRHCVTHQNPHTKEVYYVCGTCLPDRVEKELTDDQRSERYVKEAGRYCPECRVQLHELNRGDFDTDGTGGFWMFTCHACGLEWLENWDLVKITITVNWEKRTCPTKVEGKP